MQSNALVVRGGAGTWEDLAEELIEDRCDGENDFNGDRMSAEARHGGTIRYLGTVDCATRCYTGGIEFTFCGVTITFRPLNDLMRYCD